VRTLTASHDVLTTLGVRPDLGRIFSAADDTPGAPNVVILSSGYWQRTFDADRGMLGRVITINGRPHQVIGVMPAGFRFEGEHDLVIPLRINPGRPNPFFRLVSVARLRPGVTLAQANADAARILRTWLDESGQTDSAFQARYAPALRPLKQDVVGDVGSTLWVLMGTIGLVLLMACANVANLLLVRANARGHEFAIRAALGSRRSRIARLLLVESLTLALLGGAFGLAIAYGGLRVLVAVGPSTLPRLSEISIDPFVLIFAFAVSLLSGLLFGLIPILKCAGPRLAAAIGNTGRGATLSRERQRSQNSLVTVQIALALVLLVSAGLMIRSFQALRRVDPGFTQPEHVQTFSITIPPAVEPDVERLRRMHEEILNRLATIPGVASAAFTTRLPMDPSDRWSAALTAEGQRDDGRTPPNRQVKVISPGMFQTLRTPLVAGRDFTWTDLYDVRDVAIISENLAREFWGSPADALGKRIRQYYGEQDSWREIVGVARDVSDDGVHQQPPATIYWPGRLPARFFGGYQPHRVSVVLRTDRAGTESLLTEMHQAVWSVNARLPLADVRTLDTLYHQSLAQTSFTLVMLAIAGAMALLLGMCGIYGVIAYAVSQRRREIGIRLALGAQTGQIRALFVRRGMILAGMGVAIGMGGAIGFTRLMRSLLFGINPLDPITFAAVPIVLAAAAVLASYLPARRAIAVDLVETMRANKGARAMTRRVMGMGVLVSLAWMIYLDAQVSLFRSGAPVPVRQGSGQVVLIDVNRDGHLDLVATHLQKKLVGVHLGDGTGLFAPTVAAGMSLQPDAGAWALGDVDGDRISDLVVATRDRRDEYIQTFLGMASGRFDTTSERRYPTATAIEYYKPTVRLVDVNGDKNPDIVTDNGRRNTVEVLLGDGHGQFKKGSTVILESGRDFHSSALGDVDGDGRLDMVATGFAPNGVARLATLRGDGKGAFLQAMTASVDLPRPRVAALADVNGDQKLDVVLTDGEEKLLSIWLNTGQGGFAPAPMSPYKIVESAFAVVVTDVNRDSRADIVAATVNSQSTSPDNSSVTVLLGGGRVFQPASGSPFRVGPGAYNLATGDVNEDGKTDIVASSFAGESVTVLLGQ
jgi:predicted permease